MQKIDLSMKEAINIIWKTVMILLLTANLLIAIATNKQITASTDVIVSNVKNTYDAVITQNNSQPEIPDANNQEYQASCPADSNILDDPGKVLAFFDAVDPYIAAKPYRLNLLIALITSDKQDVVDQLLTEYSAGYPRD